MPLLTSCPTKTVEKLHQNWYKRQTDEICYINQEPIVLHLNTEFEVPFIVDKKMQNIPLPPTY